MTLSQESYEELKGLLLKLRDAVDMTLFRLEEEREESKLEVK